ncbi:MAG: TIGR00282 family metallophosphoesterase [candidate division Zixibacteria bacterium]|nr:TIGR00282 family metallophosphoesterase [candidate division Zixibacteria bacterium]
MANFRLMFIADVNGKSGRQATSYMIKPLREKFSIDYVIANTENAAGGFGVTPEMAKKFFSYGIDLQTSGNHIWDRYEIISYLNQKPKFIRPANFPTGVPGVGYYIDEVENQKIGIINLMGRTYMKDIDCPFKVGLKLAERIKEDTNIIFVDMHAEATSEKQAMAYYLDGMVTAVIGTHTHVQTADEQVSDSGTAYLGDAGMTGPHDSIIGMEKEPALQRFLTGMPKRFSTASNDVRISGVIIDCDILSGNATAIKRFQYSYNPESFDRDKFLEQIEDF